MSSVTNVGGPSGSALGSFRVRWISIGCVGHGSSSASGTTHGLSASFLPWLNQSCTSNWIHAPASRLSVVAGMNSSRVRSSRLIVRAFGSSSLSSGSRTVSSSGTLRPKRLPSAPISGSSRSLNVPSSVRAVR